MAQPSRVGWEDWIERVRTASDIVEVVSQHLALKKVGRNFVGLCPFHPDRSPSLSVNAERQFYHCFSCGAGGDVFKFVQELEKVTFPEALEALSRRAGIQIPERQRGEAGRRAPLLDALEAAAVAYSAWLSDPETGRKAREHLRQRGVSADAANDFRLGWAPAGWESLSQKLRGRFPEPVLVQAGLVARREASGSGVYDRFRERLVVPLVDSGGRVVGFGARALGEEQPKYLNSPETALYHKSSFLFGLDRARKAVGPEDELNVVEGYFDAIALHQVGIRNSVATSGTALTAEQAKLLRRAASRVLLAFDGDEAGCEAALRSLAVLLAEGLEVRVMSLAADEDPDTLVRKGGAAAWSGARQAALDPVAFVQRHRMKAEGGGDPREPALQAVVKLVAGVRDPIRARLLVERAEEVFGVPGAVLARAARLKGAGYDEKRPLRAELRAQLKPKEAVEMTLLRAVLHQPSLLEGLRHRLAARDFEETSCRALAEALWEGDQAAVQESPLARQLLAEGLGGTDWEAEADWFARKLMKRKLTRELKITQQQIRDAPPDEIAGLQRRIEEIGHSIKELTP